MKRRPSTALWLLCLGLLVAGHLLMTDDALGPVLGTGVVTENADQALELLASTCCPEQPRTPRRPDPRARCVATLGWDLQGAGMITSRQRVVLVASQEEND